MPRAPMGTEQHQGVGSARAPMAPQHPLLVRPFALGALAVAIAGSTLGAILL